MKKLTFLVASAALMFAACSEPIEEPLREIELSSDTVSAPTKQQTILGKPIENPYSLDYMRKALDEYRKTTLSKAALNYEIKANFLHVRFLPANPEQFEQLLADTTIELFNRPMLCEIEQEGDYYHDPSLPEDAITWQYTTVPIDYKFPNIEYEILDSCFVPEDEPETLSKSLRGFNPENLTAIAFRLAGQEYEEEKTLTKKRKVPSGHMYVKNTMTNNWDGIVDIKVRVYNGIRWDHAYTNKDGYYSMSKHYATGLHYHIKFRTSDDIIINNLMIDIDAADKSFGWHSKSGYDGYFDSGSKGWMWATVNNAVYIFRKELCPHFNIPTPNVQLHIYAANKTSKLASKTGCAPMCRHRIILLPQLLELAALYTGIAYFGSEIASSMGPDVMIFYRGTTEEIYSTVFHEMSHVCHCLKVSNAYWQKVIQYTIAHKGYGNRKNENSGYTGVAEMWAYYFGSYVCSQYYLSYTNYWYPTRDWFKPTILKEVSGSANLTPRQIFDCLTTDVIDHNKLKTQLVNSYPQKNTIINNIFKQYGF